MDILTRIELPSISNLPKDTVSMNLSWTDINTLAQVDQLCDTIPFWFLNTIPTGGLAPLGNFIGPEISRAANVCRVKAYNVTGKLQRFRQDGKWKTPPIGSPVAESTFTLVAVGSPANGRPLPAEVAYAVTLEAVGRAAQPVEAPNAEVPPVDSGDRPRQRYTGKVYIGPLHTGAIDSVNNQCRPSSALRDTALMAFDELDLKAFQDAGARLAIWSRADGVMRTVDAVSADDAFDTQRRRGNQPSIRTRRDI